jgi:acetyl-CoA C-acetyltransferase
VLVGIGVASQRCDDPTDALEPFRLMVAASAAAGRDAGCPDLLSGLDAIRVPRGFWDYSDPGRLVADALGASSARTVLAQVGILQQTLIDDACRAIAAGVESSSLVVGGDTKYRSLRAKLAGVAAPDTVQTDVAPDAYLEPKEPFWIEAESSQGLRMPADFFTVIESALRFARGLGVEEHRDRVAALWARLSEVAADNPHAWRRTPGRAGEIRDATAANPMIAFPYTKQHNSDWNVDQAGALLLCSVETARAKGVPEEGWVYPLSGTENNHVLPLAARPQLHRSPGAEIAGARALDLAGRAVDDLDFLELYSCFPASVQLFADALGIGVDRTLTVTGGMRFAGGPLNNYVIQATARMAERLREKPGRSGLVTSVSGFFNKQGFGVWGSEPPQRGFQFADVSEEVAAAAAPREVSTEAVGPAVIVGYTVLYAGENPAKGVAVCDLPDGRRTVARTEDPVVAAAMTREEFCGRSVTIRAGGEWLEGGGRA